MDLRFLDRDDETRRIRRALRDGAGALVVVYGRRRVGKSRLIDAAIDGPRVLYVGDDRDASVQRADLSREMARLVPRMADVVYPGWLELLDRFFAAAPQGTVLVIDELPSLVKQSPELPSVLQKICDRRDGIARRIVLCGSSQRMMQGLVLDATAPLYGRAREILKVEPLPAPWIREALRTSDAVDAIERYAVWGGVPRYWELARGFRTHAAALRELVLDPRGVLHREPERILLDELETTARAASVLALVGSGSRRMSEIAGRLGVPATSLSRPVARLVELGFLSREIPFGVEERDAKRSFYRITDPFLAFWFRFVDRNRSLLAGGRVRDVEADVQRQLPQHVAEIHEDLCRRALPALMGRSTGIPRRWWGRGADGATHEVDVVATRGARELVIGEVKRSLDAKEVEREVARLEAIATTIPGGAARARAVVLFALRGTAVKQTRIGGARIVGADELLDALD
jgi:AAA+ ATPase superfamily predicted ATPase